MALAASSMAHILVKTEWLLFKQRLCERFLLDLHIIILFLVELVEETALVGLSLRKLFLEVTTSIRSRPWHVHAKNGPEITKFPILCRHSLDGHGAHE